VKCLVGKHLASLRIKNQASKMTASCKQYDPQRPFSRQGSSSYTSELP
jgi:hypothetical protein